MNNFNTCSKCGITLGTLEKCPWCDFKNEVQNEFYFTSMEGAGFKLMCIGKDLIWYLLSTFTIGFNFGFWPAFYHFPTIELLSVTKLEISIASIVFSILFFVRIYDAGKILFYGQQDFKKKYRGYNYWITYMILCTLVFLFKIFIKQ